LKIRELCTKYDAWLHIDAAFGLYARALPSHAALAANIELGDSMTSDGHKVRKLKTNVQRWRYSTKMFFPTFPH
jgi:hypothetical protein